MEFDASLRQADIALVELLTILGLPLVPLHSNVLVLTDSFESLRVLRRGLYNPLLDQLSRVVRRHVFSGSISPRLSFIPDNFNVRAEQFSRGLTISTEWSINIQDFQELLGLAGLQPQLDLFATDLNNHCGLYMSPCPGLLAVGSTHSPLLGQLGSAASVPPDSVEFIGFGGAVVNSFRHRNLCVPGAGGLGLGSRPALPSSQIVQAILRLHQLVQESLMVLREQTLLFPFTYQKVSLMGLCPLFSFIRACVPSRPPFICQGLSEPLD